MKPSLNWDSFREKALEAGFTACGLAPAESLEDLRADLDQWLASGKAGEMAYLERNRDVRLDPGKLVEGAQTVITLAAPYYYPLEAHTPGNPRISRYALGEDYHGVLKSRLHELLTWLRAECGGLNGRVFTDSAPILEREWAQRSGLGWIGKNGCLIIPKQGSYFFLAEIIVDRAPDLLFDLRSDSSSGSFFRSSSSSCGTCTRCIDICPTRALNGDGSVDPRKCISYLTIEHRSEIPEEMKGSWSDWIFGCDMCQDVCPFNRKPTPCAIPALEPRPELAGLTREAVSDLDEAGFQRLFKGTPVERTGLTGILRNFNFLYGQAE